MDFKQETVASFFGRQKVQFRIPEYQRAYSWEELQLRVFLEDLHEHAHGDNKYCYGNILLEKVLEGKKYDIVDGQQRIMTLSIFIRSLLNVIKKRMDTGSTFETVDGKLIIEDEEDQYFKDHGIVRLRPVQYDQACYDTIIIENKDSYNAITPSQQRMVKAKSFFEKELDKLRDEELVKIFETARNAVVNRIEFTGKREASLMFELQNNRGKNLTNLEKLKSFLMYQTYVYSDASETDANIEYISNQFNPIYSIVNSKSLQLNGDEDSESSDIMADEDSILIYHSYAYSKKHFGYRNLNDIIAEFKTVQDDEKVRWIKEYADELYHSFSNLRDVLSMNNESLKKLKRMKIPFFVYPFLIKGAKNKQSLPELFRLMEVLSFRYKLIGSRADIRSRLSELIQNYNGDNNALAAALKAKMDEAYYWGDIRFAEALNSDMYHNSMINYFLWEYEQDVQIKGYISGARIENESIEHISPQTEPDEKVESGYEVDSDGLYTKDFREKYINRLGNLMLISQSHNSSIGNKPFRDKLLSYQNNPLLRQQIKISDYVKVQNNPTWGSSEIDQRHTAMVNFAIRRWSFQ